MATFKAFDFDLAELQEHMTFVSHQTLAWLCNEDYITEEQYEDLSERLIIVPVRNNGLYGKIKQWMFGGDKNPDLYKFAISDIKHK